MNRKGIVYFNNIKCGVIEEINGDYIFTYDNVYLDRLDAKPISLTMPLRKEEYISSILFSFFDGLIPEGWLLELALVKWKTKRNDRFGLLLTVCKDTIGAVSIEVE